MGKTRHFYPELEPYNSGMLPVSDLHTLYYEESGNPKGKPAVFLHGGPGGRITPFYRRFFDPEYYRIVIFCQRGAGFSTPKAEIRENTTWDLVEDMEKLRTHLNIHRWLVAGGSWGTTLGLAYAVTHPSRVSGMVLFGIYLGTGMEDNWVYNGGAAHIYPDMYEEFLAPIPEAERGDVMQAYMKRLTCEDEQVRLTAARAWSVWEQYTAKLIPDRKSIRFYKNDVTQALTFATIECHYFSNNLFMPHDTWLLEKCAEIDHIPTILVQGRYDINCPAAAAWELHKAMPSSDLRFIPLGDHWPFSGPMKGAVIKAIDDFKREEYFNGTA